MYQLTNSAFIKRLSDGAFIPEDSGNRDWQDYERWVADGNAPLPAEQEPFRDSVWADYRSRRDLYLARLAGIAQFDDAGDGFVREACKTFRLRLLDLPAHPEVTAEVTPDREALELAIVTLYRAAVDEATAIAPAARVAFSKISN